LLAVAFAGRAFSDIERDLSAARRAAILGRMPLDEGLANLVSDRSVAKERRIHVASALVTQGLLSQRKAGELTGVARDTIRAHATPRAKKPKSRGAKEAL
jgi:hypothetical protein